MSDPTLEEIAKKNEIEDMVPLTTHAEMIIELFKAVKILAIEIKSLREEFSGLLLCENCFYAKPHEGDWAECFLPENLAGDGVEAPLDGMQVYKKANGCKNWKSKKRKNKNERRN